MLGGIDRRRIDFEREGAAIDAFDRGLGNDLDEVIVAQPIGDEIGDGGDLEPVTLGEGDEVRQARHGAVVVHDLADHAGRIKSGKTRDVDGGLGMAGADQHAAVLGDQREDVAGRHDVAEVLGGIDGDGDGMRAVMRGDAGADAFARLDGDGESRGVARAVRARHQFEMKLLGAVGVSDEADQARGRAWP